MATYVCSPAELPVRTVFAVPLWTPLRRAIEVAVRRMQKPAAVRRLAQLAPREWPLMGTCDADDAAVIATNAALHRLAGPDGTGDWSRWGWEQISRIEWKEPTSTLALVGQVPLLAGRVALTLPTPGPLMEVILERLAWTTMLTTKVSLPSGGNLAVLVRRQPATDRMDWFLYPEASLDVIDAGIRSEIDDAVAALRADTGL